MDLELYLYIIVMFIILILYLIYNNGFYRYFMLHYNEDNYITYVNNYRYIPYHRMNCKVIVSFTTIPKRINKLKPMVLSILNQSIRIDQIALNISPDVKREINEIPSYLSDIVNIYYCGKEYGPSTKCIPTLLREEDAETILILVDDDYVYGYDFIETVLNKMEEIPNTALYSKGFIASRLSFFKEDIIDTTKSYIRDEQLLRYIKVEKEKFIYSENYRSYLC